MRSLRTFFVVAALISVVTLATSHSARSGEKRCQTISACVQPISVACTSPTSQPAAPVQTCCQPAAASVQPRIELVAYARPAAPRRLTPQPDALELRRTANDLACAQFVIEEHSDFAVYQAILCSDMSIVQIIGSGLGPLPGDCANPNGACVEFAAGGGGIAKTVRLAQKRKAGQEPRNQPNALATGPHKLTERTRIGQPVYIEFAAPNRASGSVIVELQRFFVRGTGKTSQELSGTVAFGTEVAAAPVGHVAKVIDLEKIQILADHAARVTIGNATYNFVTATSLVQE